MVKPYKCITMVWFLATPHSPHVLFLLYLRFLETVLIWGKLILRN